MGYLGIAVSGKRLLSLEGLTLKYILRRCEGEDKLTSQAVSRRRLTHDNIENSAESVSKARRGRTGTHFTAGANAFSGTIPNPAARTAADWRKAAATRLPTGIASMTLGRSQLCKGDAHEVTYGLPMSNTRKQTQSVNLQGSLAGDPGERAATYVSVTMTKTRNQVWVLGNR